MVRTTDQEDPSDFQTVTLTVSGNGVTEAVPPPPAAHVRGRLALTPTSLRRSLRMVQATSREHQRLHAEGEALLRRVGPSAVLREPAGPRPVAAAALPPKLVLDVGRSCDAGPQATALLIAEDERIAIYQDSTSNAGPDSRVTIDMANVMLAYFRDFGLQIIDGYFGANSDIDGNGKLIVFITPSIGEDTIGLIWTGNFLARASCPGSNEGEYVYLSHVPVVELLDPELPFSLALHALVHEAKHVTSMYQRILRADGGDIDFHPFWHKEGGAEIAAELAARLAWHTRGGPNLHITVSEEHLGSTTTITSENIAMLFMLLRAQETLSVQPNSLVIAPPGGPSDYEYGSGWLFLRFLADAYGNSGGAPMADAPFFRALSDPVTASGSSGITSMTGRTWSKLMEEYVAAAMLNGQTDLPVPGGITSYNFPSAIEIYCFTLDPKDVPNPRCLDDEGSPLPEGAPGAYPWPVTTDSQGNVTTRSFASATYSGMSGPSGMRVHDFTSNGTGFGAEINVSVTENGPARVVVVRLR